MILTSTSTSTSSSTTTITTALCVYLGMKWYDMACDSRHARARDHTCTTTPRRTAEDGSSPATT